MLLHRLVDHSGALFTARNKKRILREDTRAGKRTLRPLSWSYSNVLFRCENPAKITVCANVRSYAFRRDHFVDLECGGYRLFSFGDVRISRH